MYAIDRKERITCYNDIYVPLLGTGLIVTFFKSLIFVKRGKGLEEKNMKAAIGRKLLCDEWTERILLTKYW